MQKIFLSCGCAANSTNNEKPSCVVHSGSPDGVHSIDAPNLEGRRARCVCGQLRPSSLDLAFFEFRGVGSPEGKRTCKNCRYYEVAHKPGAHNGICKNFESIRAFEYDSFYCGCYGWD